MNSSVRTRNASGSTLARIPEGFWPPFQCHSGIMAKSTMHQAKARTTHTFSSLCAGFHHTPRGDSTPVCISTSRYGRGAQGSVRISTSPHPV